ncbi:MAG: hypothetical protein H7263_17050 [Candidatus Sericytochromatia bacterium]|nr:hypothetical protein [Candidatus Sericytochromatia bacterium]
MIENSFRFKNGDLEIEFSGEKDYVESQIENWKNFINSSNKSNFSKNKTDKELNNYRNNDTPEIRIIKNISIEEFIDLKKPNDDLDKVIVAAYYLEKYEKCNSFSENDLYKLLNVENVERYILINMEKGLLSLSNEENNMVKYTLTYSGEMYVREGLQSIL